VKAISVSGSAAAPHPASASMCAVPTATPSSIAQQVLEHDLEREGRAAGVETLARDVDVPAGELAAVDRQSSACIEAVDHPLLRSHADDGAEPQSGGRHDPWR